MKWEFLDSSTYDITIKHNYLIFSNKGNQNVHVIQVGTSLRICNKLNTLFKEYEYFTEKNYSDHCQLKVKFSL